MDTEYEKQIAHHEKEASQWTEAGKRSKNLPTLLECLKQANHESKEVARLVAKMNGWGETEINQL